MMKTATILALLLTGASCAAAADGATTATDDVREATYRHQFLHSRSAQQQEAKAYFLSISERGEDPSDSFMKRFADHKPVVRKWSNAEGGMKGVRDKGTGESGIIFFLSGIRWVSEVEAEVDGGYIKSSLSASFNTYYLKKEEGKWVVTREVLRGLT